MVSHNEIITSAVKLGRFDRRHMLGYTAALSSVALLGRSSQAATRPSFKSDPFTLGVASGDPDASSVVLWTKLAPTPREPGGGMMPEDVEVRWEVFADEGATRVVAAGKAVASPKLGHTVHVEVDGLQPNRWYCYRFHAGDASSPLGRTRTLPLADAMPERLNFAFASCQNYEQGLFTAYEQMAKDNLDLVFHLGDYIYEYEAGRNGKIRTHLGAEINSLDDYRIRHSQYRADPLLHQMHAQCPWFVTWDDHEFDNNCAADISEETGVAPAAFLARRAAAYQAYYEMMPLRAACLPKGPDMKLYRKASFGRLAEFLVLDARQYRSDQPNNDKKSPLNEAAWNPTQTMLGQPQREWLEASLKQSTAQWNVFAQQVMMGMFIPNGDAEKPIYSMDQWPGYAHERVELMKFVQNNRIKNPVVLTGDIHSNWANELRIDDTKPDQPSVAVEFVGTSISSGGNGKQYPDNLDKIYAANPGVKFHNAERGYVRCTVTPKEWKSDYIVVDDVTNPGGKASTRAAFVVESEKPKLEKV
ncbi:MAG: alkaline phosphatase D family protein [Pirellulales bacterium]